MDAANRNEQWEAWFLRWDKILRADAKRMARNKAHQIDPSQIAADALTKTFLRLHQFRGNTDDELRAWVRRILANDVNELLSRARTRDQALTGEVVSRGPDPADKLDQADMAAALKAALEKLSADDKELLLLAHGFRGDLSREMIADTLKITTEALRARVSRARRRLKEVMVDG